MRALSLVSLLVAFASIAASPPRTTIRTQQHQASDVRSCELTLVALDGESLGTPKQKLSVSPGRHSVVVRVWFIAKGRAETVDVPLTVTFKAHRYLLDGGFVPSGHLNLVFEDEDEQPAGEKHEKMR
jgi:hypothetical protein